MIFGLVTLFWLELVELDDWLWFKDVLLEWELLYTEFVPPIILKLDVLFIELLNWNWLTDDGFLDGYIYPFSVIV